MPPGESVWHRGFILVSAALLSSWAAACGDGATEPAPVPNRAPVLSGSIPAQTIAVGDTGTVNVASYFSDPDGDALIYTAANSNTATASVSVSGSVVTVTATARGVATITVTAQDPGGLSAQSTFTVTVPNREPVAVDTVAAQNIFVGETAAVDVAGYFTDPDGDALTYSATSSDSTAVSASVAGSVVSVAALAQGMFTVTVTARDPDGLSAQQSIAVTVPNRAPETVGAIPSQTLFAGQSFRLDLSAYFDDPDEDALAYMAASADSGVAAVSVAGDTVTIVGITPGETSVTMTATDSGGLSAQQNFAVTVPNRAPDAVGAVPAQTVFVGETASVDVAAYFDDPDGEALTHTAASSNSTVVSASVAGSVVSLEAITQGSATVAVTARDPGGLSVEQSFTVTVPNRRPTAVGTIPSQTLFAGQTITIDVSAYFDDPDGDALTHEAASADARVVTVMAANDMVTVTGTAPGETSVTITGTDPGGMSARQTFAVTVPNRGPVAGDTIPGRSVERGRTVAVDVSPFFGDPDGETLTYAAASSNTAIATVTVASATARVAGVTQGTATITVTATDPGGLFAQQRFSVAVTEANRAPVVVQTIPAATLTVGATRAWRGADHFRDPDGGELTYAARSSSTAVIRPAVSGAEFSIHALSPGAAEVTVTASDPEGLSAELSFRVTVRPETQGEVVISGVEPAVLVEGAEARITGSGFSVTAAENQVSVGGLAARVTSATPTSLSIMVPRSDCQPPRRDELRVSVGSQSDARTVGVTPWSAENYSAFEAGYYVNSDAGKGCVHLSGGAFGAEYLIGVVSTSEVPSSLTGVTLAGTPGDATVIGAANRAVAPGGQESVVVSRAPFESLAAERGALQAAASADFRSEDASLVDDSLRARRARAHNEMMARNEALLRELGRSSLPETAADAYRQVEVGDTIALYAEYAYSRWTCSEARQVNAVVRLVGNHTIWLDDVANPSGTFTDAELAELDSFYGTNIESVLDSYFGGLSDVDGNGRILILMTQETNRAENTAGYVFPGDLYPATTCATSNHAEIFYGIVPDPSGVVGDPKTKAQVLAWYPSLIAHEVAHIVQSGAQVLNNAGLKKSWEMEGGATLAEQLVAYRLYGQGSGRNLGYGAYSASRAWNWKWVDGTALFFGRGPEGGRTLYAPEQCSWVGTPQEGNSGPCKEPHLAVYGVPTLVFRYALDRWGAKYPGGEQAMMRHLTQSPTTGFASLEDVGSWPIERILAEFYLGLWADGRVRADGLVWNTMASWDLYDIFSRLGTNAQLEPYTSRSSNPRASASIRAGSSLYLHWTPTGSLSPTAIKVTSANGGPVPNHISVWALRVR